MSPADWSKLVLTGERRATSQLFSSLLTDPDAAGRLVLDGDAIEFLALRSAKAQLLVAQMTAPPYHPESADVLLEGAVRIVFLFEASYAHWLQHVQSLAPRGALELFDPKTASSARLRVSAIIGATLGDRAESGAVDFARSLPEDFPYFVVKNRAPFGGNIWGRGPYGTRLHDYPRDPTK